MTAIRVRPWEPVFVCPGCYHRETPEERGRSDRCVICDTPLFEKQRCQSCGQIFFDPYTEDLCPLCRSGGQ